MLREDREVVDLQLPRARMGRSESRLPPATATPMPTSIYFKVEDHMLLHPAPEVLEAHHERLVQPKSAEVAQQEELVQTQSAKSDPAQRTALPSRR